MTTAVHVKTKVLPGGRIEIFESDLPVGEEVDVFVYKNPPRDQLRSAMDVIREAPKRRGFKTAEEVDDFIREERDSWDR